MNPQDQGPPFFELAGRMRAMRRSKPDRRVFEDGLHARFEIPTHGGGVVAMPTGWPLAHFGPVTRRPAREITDFDRWGDTDPGNGSD